MSTIKTINPYNQSIIQEYQTLSSVELDKVLQQSEKAFIHWRKTNIDARKQVLKNAANILRRDKESLAKLITTEMGKVITEAKAEVEKCAGALDYYAGYGGAYLRNISIPSSASHNSYLTYDPIGTILAIMPWNYPLWQVIRYAAPCLLSGNVTILKHAPSVLGCAETIEKIFLEAGSPQGVFQNIIIDTDLVEQCIAHKAVQGITLTGSTKAGSHVAMLAGKYIKKSVMELGGSDPFIVLADADIQQAVKVAVQSRMMNAGQACICAKRFIIHKKIKEAFQEQFIAEVKTIKTGNPLDEAVQMGPMARLDLAEKLQHQADVSHQKGATKLTGGLRDKCFYEPTIFTDIQQGMPLYEEEAFGPLAALFIADDEKDAVRIANNSPYGLGASIWSRDIAKAEIVAKQIEAGGVFINALVHSDPRLPFGGIKQSGYGRELSEVGIKEFMNIKTIYINK